MRTNFLLPKHKIATKRGEKYFNNKKKGMKNTTAFSEL